MQIFLINKTPEATHIHRRPTGRSLVEDAHLSTHFSDRRSPQASRLCYLLGAKEDGYVQDMLGKLKADPGPPGTS